VSIYSTQYPVVSADRPHSGGWQDDLGVCGQTCHVLNANVSSYANDIRSIVVEDISLRYPTSQRTGVTFAYCSYKDPKTSKDPTAFLASFVLQLARQREELFRPLKDLYTTHSRDARTPNFSTLCEVFRSIVAYYDALFVIFDALDECEQRADYMKFLQELVCNVGRSSCCIKLFVTSRREHDIQRAFSTTPKVEVAAEKVQHDIDSFVKHEIQERKNEGHLALNNPDLEARVIESLCSRASGMFLWVSYQLDHICEQSQIYSDVGVIEALETLPESMDETYAHILMNIDKKPQRDWAKNALMLVAFAERPLSLKELSVAAAIKDQRSTATLGVPSDPAIILRICSNLLTVTSDSIEWIKGNSVIDPDLKVQFLHFSIREFLFPRYPREPRGLIDTQLNAITEFRAGRSSSDAHTQLCLACLTYLSLEDFHYFPHGSPDEFDRFVSNDAPFTLYASEFWPRHLTQVTDISENLRGRIRDFLLVGSPSFCFYLHSAFHSYIRQQRT